MTTSVVGRAYPIAYSLKNYCCTSASEYSYPNLETQIPSPISFSPVPSTNPACRFMGSYRKLLGDPLSKAMAVTSDFHGRIPPLLAGSTPSSICCSRRRRVFGHGSIGPIFTCNWCSRGANASGKLPLCRFCDRDLEKLPCAKVVNEPLEAKSLKERLGAEFWRILP